MRDLPTSKNGGHSIWLPYLLLKLKYIFFFKIGFIITFITINDYDYLMDFAIIIDTKLNNVTNFKKNLLRNTIIEQFF